MQLCEGTKEERRAKLRKSVPLGFQLVRRLPYLPDLAPND